MSFSQSVGRIVRLHREASGQNFGVVGRGRPLLGKHGATSTPEPWQRSGAGSGPVAFLLFLEVATDTFLLGQGQYLENWFQVLPLLS